MRPTGTTALNTRDVAGKQLQDGAAVTDPLPPQTSSRGGRENPRPIAERTAVSTHETITQWLAELHSRPVEAITEWTRQGVALLPMGGSVCAIRLDSHLVHAAMATAVPDEIASGLARDVQGPVVFDRRASAYYAFVDTVAAAGWDLEAVPCLGAGVYVGVPALDRVGPSAPYWVVQPRYAGHLCPVDAVRTLVAAGMAGERT